MYIVYICAHFSLYIYIERKGLVYRACDKQEYSISIFLQHICLTNFKNEETSEENILRVNLQHYQSSSIQKDKYCKKTRSEEPL